MNPIVTENLARVNDEGKWYWVRDLTEIYYDSNCSNETFFAVWESDGECYKRCSHWNSQCIEMEIRVDNKIVSVQFHKSDDEIYANPRYLWSRSLINKAAIPLEKHTLPSWSGAPFNSSELMKAKFYKRP